MEKARTPFLSIVIPVYNDEPSLLSALESLYRSRYSDFECIVVDDGSTSMIRADSLEFPVSVIRLDERRGPAYARNRGVDSAQGEWVIFFDADIRVYPDTLEKFARRIKSHPETVAFFGSYDHLPAARDFLSQYRNLLHHFVHQTANANSCSFWAACGAIRREIFLELSGFLETYTLPSVEDIELGYRMAQRNLSILLCKEIVVTHTKRWPFYEMVKTDIYQRAVPWTVLSMRYRRIVNDLNIKNQSRFSALALDIGLLAALASFRNTHAIVVTLVCILLYGLLNGKYLKTMKQLRGWWFAARVVPLHILYYFYAQVGMVLGLITYWRSRLLRLLGVKA